MMLYYSVDMFYMFAEGDEGGHAPIMAMKAAVQTDKKGTASFQNWGRIRHIMGKF